MSEMVGCRVRITKCLTSKPPISDVPSVGYSLQDTLDRADRTQFEQCKAVGLVSSFYDDGLYAVAFFKSDPFVGGKVPATTMLFVHEDHMQEIDAPLQWPEVDCHVGRPRE